MKLLWYLLPYKNIKRFYTYCLLHIFASVLWFLGNYRHQQNSVARPCRTYGDSILNAVDEDSETDSENSIHSNDGDDSEDDRDDSETNSEDNS